MRQWLTAAAALLAAAVATGCTSTHLAVARSTASVPLSFAPIAPTPTPAASSATTTAAPAGSPSNGTASPNPSPTPCPVDAPQVLAEVSAATDDSGDIVVTYRAAQRSCTGKDSTYFTSGPNDLQAVVDPLAEIRMVLPGVAGDYNLLDPIDLPDAMSNPSYRYFGLTFSPTGTIIAMLQYAYP